VLASRLAERCTLGAADAIIALEGDAGQEHIIHALRMFRYNWAPVLIVTGTSSLPDGWRYFDTATLFGMRDNQIRRIEVKERRAPMGKRWRSMKILSDSGYTA
jgi:hypothetical protein